MTDAECNSVTKRKEDLQLHISMVHDARRVEQETEAEHLEVEAKKISAETKKIESETASRVADRGPAEAARGLSNQKGERKAPMERPSIDEGITEGDWSFFQAEWDRYVGAVGLKDDDPGATRHLWSACSESLRRALHNDGARDVASPKVLLSRIKSLAVKRRNNLVNVMTLQGARGRRSRFSGQAEGPGGPL